MRIPLNLATEPPENLRPVQAAVALAAVVLVLLAAAVLQRELRARSEFRSQTEQMQSLRSDLAALEKEQQELEAWMATPQVLQIRDRSAFLNSIILQKSLSWTQMFLDLEKTLPTRVRIQAIRPSGTGSEQADLSLTVAADSTDALVEFLKNLESSPRFGAPTVGAQRFPAERAASGVVELDLTTRYRPATDRPPAVSAPLPTTTEGSGIQVSATAQASTGEQR
jgi:Tfp pilus assembly protein PilN